jgi:hypothetical protein
MHLGLLLVLLQQAPPPQPAIAKVDVTPAAGVLEIGHTLNISARALDANGKPVANAQIRYFVGSDNGEVDSTGVVTAGYAGPLRVVAMAFVPGQQGSTMGEAVFRAMPEPPARVVVDPMPTRLAAGTQLTLVATAFSKQNDRRPDQATFTSSNPRVASVSADGVLRAVAPGRASVTVAVGSAQEKVALQVVPNPLGRITIEPAVAAVRTGDVLRLTTTPKDVAVAWSLGAGAGAAVIDHSGAFVAEVPGVYTVRATIGTRSAESVIRVEQRRVTRGIEVRAHLPIAERAAEVWVHPNGTCVSLDDRGPGLRHRRLRCHPADRGFHDERRPDQQRRDDHRGRQVRRVLTGGSVKPQERHRDLRRERPLSSQGHRRVYRDGDRRSAQLVCVSGPRLPHR